MAVTALDILRRRIDALLHHSGLTRKELAAYMGRQPSWTTDFLLGHNGVSVKDLDRIARFFGLSVAALFELDGFRFRDRRKGERRTGTTDRRASTGERRREQIHASNDKKRT